MTTKVFIQGASGRMGLAIQEILGESKDKALKLSDSLAAAELILDFSTVEGNQALLKTLSASKSKAAVLIGTTGLEKKQLGEWEKLAKKNNCCVLIAPNTSMGIFLLSRICEMFGAALFDSGFDIEIAEIHHRNKVDAPSGTAKLLAQSLNKAVPKLKVVSGSRNQKRSREDLGIQSLRGGAVFGEHDVKFLGDNEEITLSHRALSRSLFAQGALKFGSWLTKQKPGYYQLGDVEF